MRRLFVQLAIFAVTAFAIGAGYRYLWNEPSQANLANYLRSGVHAMGLAACGLGAHLYFSAYLSKRLRRWPLVAEIALRAAVMAVTVSTVATVLQTGLYEERPQSTWFFAEFPRIVGITFVLSALFGAAFELCDPGTVSASHPGRARADVPRSLRLDVARGSARRGAHAGASHPLFLRH